MKVVITIPAQFDLNEIFYNIAFELYAPISAKNTVNCINKSFELLELMPEIHPVYDNEPWKSKGVRIYHEKKYRIFYRINYKKGTVTINRIIPAGMDIDRALSETDFDEIT